MTSRTETGPATRILVIDRNSELATRLRHHVVAGGAVVKSCPDTARAETHLAGAHWDAVVAGPSLMHGAGLRRLASLHSRYPWVAKVLALHERPRADLAEIVRAGASDLVALHADDNELRRTLARAARITRGRLGPGTSAAGAGQGRVVMVSSASGGCGKTFLATNAAEFLARTTGQPVVLLDLDLQFGEVSTALRLRPEVTITDALAAEAEGFDLEEILDEYLLTHPDGFKVLAAPRHPAEADSVTPGDVTRILDVLRARRAWVVIDTHEGLSDLFVAALEATDHVFAVATPDRPSLVNLGRYLGALERLGMTAGNISVVLNKAWELDQPPPRDTGLDPLDMALELGRRFEAMVPYSREIALSVNVGVPLLVGKPKSPISARLTEALSAVLPESRRPDPVVVSPAPAPTPFFAAASDLAPVIEARPAERSAAVVAAAVNDPVPAESGEESAEIDVTDTPVRRCSAVVRARPPRCRRSTEPAVPCPERGPPQSISPHSSPALVLPPPPNDPAGLSVKPRTPPTREERESAVKPHVNGDFIVDAPVLSNADPRSGRLRDRSGRRPRLVHGLG